MGKSIQTRNIVQRKAKNNNAVVAINMSLVVLTISCPSIVEREKKMKYRLRMKQLAKMRKQKTRHSWLQEEKRFTN